MLETGPAADDGPAADAGPAGDETTDRLGSEGGGEDEGERRRGDLCAGRVAARDAHSLNRLDRMLNRSGSRGQSI